MSDGHLRSGPVAARAAVGLAVLVAGCAGAAAAAPRCVEHAGHRAPHTLVLALDGIPLRVAERARAEGAFAGWTEPVAMVAPFPTMTNVSFTAMLEPFGVGPAGGYEVQHFSLEANAIVGGTPFGYGERLFPWRDAFDRTGRTVGAKLATYTTPRRKLAGELEAIERAMLAEPCELFMAHLGSTDAIQHMRGDETGVELLLSIDRWLARLAARHRAELGCPLRTVVLSDHGNTDGKVHGVRGLRRRLRRAGLHPAHHLEFPDDVVAATFGLASYGALHVRPRMAERAARAVAGHPAVEVAAWRSAVDEVRIVSRNGDGRVRWRDAGPDRRLAYGAVAGDPLLLAGAVARMDGAGLVDAEGYARAGDWLRHTLDEHFPDAPRRLVEAFAGTHVVNRAAVLFSLRPGRSWGWRAAMAGSWLAGGRLEGTHGGLDRAATLGFWVTDDRTLHPGAAVTAGEALLPLLPSWRRTAACRAGRATEGVVSGPAAGSGPRVGPR